MNTEITLCNTEDGDAGVQTQLCAENEKECDEAHEETEQCTGIKTEEKFNLKDESCDSAEVSAEHKTVSNIGDEKTNEGVNDLSQIITEKLKFLSEGRENVSAVRTMQIQLQVSIHLYIYVFFHHIYILFHHLFYITLILFLKSLIINMNFTNINCCIHYRHYLLHGRQVA